MRKRKITVLTRKEDARQGPNFEGGDFIPGPKLRAKFGISAVTLWRWRRDPENSFPTPQGDQRAPVLPGDRRFGLDR